MRSDGSGGVGKALQRDRLLQGEQERGRKGSRAGWNDFVVLLRIWQKPEMATENSESEGGCHLKLERSIVC